MIRHAQVKGHIAVVDMLLDHGADVNKANDDGATALSVTLALLLRDGRHEPTPPGLQSPPSDQLDTRVGPGSPAAVDSTRTIGRLSVSRANRAVITNLLNDRPIPPPTIYFDAAGQIQTLDATDLKAMDQTTIDQKAGDQSIDVKYTYFYLYINFASPHMNGSN